MLEKDPSAGRGAPGVGIDLLDLQRGAGKDDDRNRLHAFFELLRVSVAEEIGRLQILKGKG